MSIIALKYLCLWNDHYHLGYGGEGCYGQAILSLWGLPCTGIQNPAEDLKQLLHLLYLQFLI